MMATPQSLDQRLGQILPGSAPSTPADQIPLEPMPGAGQDIMVDSSPVPEIGTPSMVCNSLALLLGCAS
jgi:hypothetical protein